MLQQGRLGFVKDLRGVRREEEANELEMHQEALVLVFLLFLIWI
jgi:hypothetical protein